MWLLLLGVHLKLQTVKLEGKNGKNKELHKAKLRSMRIMGMCSIVGDWHVLGRSPAWEVWTACWVQPTSCSGLRHTTSVLHLPCCTVNGYTHTSSCFNIYLTICIFTAIVLVAKTHRNLLLFKTHVQLFYTCNVCLCVWLCVCVCVYVCLYVMCNINTCILQVRCSCSVSVCCKCTVALATSSYQRGHRHSCIVSESCKWPCLWVLN